MATAPIYNPIVPCIHMIPGGFYPGKMLRVQGNIPPNAQRFAINLQCGPNTDPRDDIALHLNFRFVERCIVRNNLSSMNWGPEEIDGGIPLNPGQGFEALILCEHNSIKVAINGNHFCEFIHRLPYQRITHMTVDGDVSLQMIGFEGTQVGGPQPGYVQSSAPPSYGAPPPAYGAPAYGAPTGMPMESYGAPMYGVSQPQRQGMGAGKAAALGAVGGLAVGGLGAYALAGGFSSDDAPSESVHISEPEPEPEPVEDFGGDDWAD